MNIIKNRLILSLGVASLVSPLSYVSSCACQINTHLHERGEIDYICTNWSTQKFPVLFQCKKCEKKFLTSLTPNDINMPILHIKGDINGISKLNKVKVSCEYFDVNNANDFNFDCTLKWQGASSIEAPKKNFNIQFFEKDSQYQKKQKITLKEGWTNESKYTLKGNWVDITQSKNSVLAKMWGKVCRTSEKEDEISKLLNGGSTDGFPIVLYVNNTFNGIYNVNIAKGKQLFETPNYKEVKPKAIVFPTNPNSLTTHFKELIDIDWTNGYEVEYSYNDDSTWIRDSFNNLIDFTINNNGVDFINGINKYIDVDRTIDFLNFLNVFGLWDNTTHNILWVTYDTSKWFPIPYDLDGVCVGLEGKKIEHFFDLYDNNLILENSFNNVTLFEKIIRLFPNKYISNQKRLISNVLSFDNISKELDVFYNQINVNAMASNIIKWKDNPFNSISGIVDTKQYILNRILNLS